MYSLILLVASGLGTGASPIAPGTMGSILALGIYTLLPASCRIVFAGLLPVSFFLGIVVAKKAENQWGQDNRRITIDEMVGMWCSLIGLPVTFSDFAEVTRKGDRKIESGRVTENRFYRNTLDRKR